MSATDLRPSEFRDPGETIAAVAGRRALQAGDVRVALVLDPSSRQELIDVIDLPAREWCNVRDYQLSRYLERKVEPLPVPMWTKGGRRHATLTIIARRGFTVIGPDEGRWISAWFYCNHLKDMNTSGLVVVTEHGWTDFMTGRGADEPALSA